MTNNQRPGVYSSYTTVSRYATPRSAKSCGLLVKLSPDLCGQVHEIDSYLAGKVLLAESYDNLVAKTCLQIMFGAGVSKVYLSGVGDSYSDAAELLEGIESIGITATDAYTISEAKQVLNSTIIASENGRERLCFFGCKDTAKATEMAEALNHERAVVVAGDIEFERNTFQSIACYGLAAEVLAKSDPSYSFNGTVLGGFKVQSSYSEADIQGMIKSGVTPIEEIEGAPSCVRAVTTRTKTDSIEDYTLRSLNTIMIIDDVISTVRKSLQQRLKGLRTTTDSLDSISSQVLVELVAKKNQGLLESVQLPRVYPHKEDPSVCVVEIAFTVAHVISQIHLTAHVQL